MILPPRFSGALSPENGQTIVDLLREVLEGKTYTRVEIFPGFKPTYKTDQKLTQGISLVPDGKLYGQPLVAILIHESSGITIFTDQPTPDKSSPDYTRAHFDFVGPAVIITRQGTPECVKSLIFIPNPVSPPTQQTH